jgi:hypothetical protein
MMKMLKDTVVTVLVVGSFAVGAYGMVNQVRELWPSPLSDDTIAMAQTTDSSSVTHHITESATQ